MLDNVGLRYPHRASGAKAPRTLRPLPLLRFAVSVLGVYEGIGEQDIIDYAQSHSPLKIAVTYDSLPRTIKALQSAGLDPYKELFLLVDE